jgi:hypothetical protein
VPAVMERAVDYIRAQAKQEQPSLMEATNVEDEICSSVQKIANHAKTLELFEVSTIEYVVAFDTRLHHAQYNIVTLRYQMYWSQQGYSK